MNNEEVNENRVVEAFLQHELGGLPSSRLSLVFARSGVGKSSFAVNFGLNYALNNQRVLHFSVGMTSDRVHEYYHEVFKELKKQKSLEDGTWNRVEKKITVITYIEPANLLAQMEAEIQTLIEEGKMEPKLIIVDGIDFHEKSGEKLKIFESIAEKQEIPVLMTLRIHRNDHGDLAFEKPLATARTFTNSIFLLDYEKENIVIHSFAKNEKQPSLMPFCIEPHSMVLQDLK